MLAGFVLGNGGLDWIDFRARSGFVEDLAFVALIVILFRDGLEVEGEMLQRAWHLPLRKLVLAMPLTTIIARGSRAALIGLSWTESFLLGALLAPTDPVLTSSIVTNQRVPRLVRHSLNLESGLNDGLALPAVLTFAAALSVDSGHFVWWRFVMQDVGLGFLYGIACGWIASLLMPRESERPGSARRSHLPPTSGRCSRSASRSRPTASPCCRRKATASSRCSSPRSCSSVRRPDVREHFERNSEEIVEIVKLGIFLVFGSLLTVHAFTREGWAAVGVRRGDVPAGAPAGGLAVAAGHAHGRRSTRSVHGLVRAQGRRVDDVRADRARPISWRTASASST